MALYAVVSAKGSPGVSTTTMALALTWPTDVLVADVDVAGGDLGLRYRAPDGQPLEPDRGLLSLAATVRNGADVAAVAAHTQTVEGGIDVLGGVSRPEQVLGLGGSWNPLATTLASLPGTDVLADCGRALPGSPMIPVLTVAEGVLFVTRPDMESLFHLRERLHWLLEEDRMRGSRRPVSVAVLTGERDGATVRDVQRTLDAASLGVSVIGPVVEDPKAAAHLRYALGGRKLDKSMLLRSAHALGEALRSRTRLDVLA